MANWIECKAYGTGEAVFVNLDMVVSIGGSDEASVITYPGSDNAQFVVEGPPGAILSKEVVG